MLSSDSYPAGARGRKFNARQNADDRPSRFLVDLNISAYVGGAGKDRRFGPEKSFFAEKLTACSRSLRDMLPGGAKLSRDGWTTPGKGEGATGSDRFEAAAGVSGSGPGILPWGVIRRLAFFPFFSLTAKFLLRLTRKIIRISVYSGWLAVFLVRFMFLSAVKLASAAWSFAPGLKRGSRLLKKKTDQDEIPPASDLIDPENFYKPQFAPEQSRPPFNSPDRSYILDLKPATEPKRIPVPPEREKLSWPKQGLIFRPRLALMKPVSYAAVIMVVLILPLKAMTYISSLEVWRGRILGVSEAAVGEIINGARLASEQNYNAATDRFASAATSFSGAREEIAYLSRLFRVLAPVVPVEEVRLAAQADLFLRAGELAADLGADSTQLFAELGEQTEWSARDALAIFKDYLKSSGAQTVELKRLMDRIDESSLPADYRETFALAKETTGLLAESWRELEKLATSLEIFLGFERDQRYLLVFQNNTEMRASGGFIGSYALMDFRDGEIRQIEAPGGGSYDTEAGLKHKIISPQPLHLVNPLWHFWDANWWPDWPASAEKLMWFYEKSDGPTVDGVISLTPTVLEDILKVIGPVKLKDDYGLTLTADNFWLEVQTLAERQPDETNRPKEIIGDALDAIMAKLPARLNKEMLADLLKLTEKNLRQKHILLYFTDERLQSTLADFGWDAKVAEAERDYLMVVNTNIAGGKSDRAIRETISHHAAAGPDGSIVNTVRVKREHTGEKKDPYSGVRNVNWARVYVPAGSELLEAGGFEFPDERYFEAPEEFWQDDPDVARTEGQGLTDPATKTRIYRENGKTVFANWTMVDPGGTIEYFFKYRLPFRLEPVIDEGNGPDKGADTSAAAPAENYVYSLLTQKQPGSIGSRFISELSLPERFKAAWQYPVKPDAADTGWLVDDVLSADRFYAVLLRKDE